MNTVTCRENSCVRIYGNLRDYEGKRHILIYSINLLEDWNELTHHLLDVVYTHLQHTKGPLPNSSLSRSINASCKIYVTSLHIYCHFIFIGNFYVRSRW